MKKFILKSVSLILVFSLVSAQGFGAFAANIINPSPNLDESVFSYDEEMLSSALSELNELDNFIEANNDVTFESLENAGSSLIANIEAGSAPMGMPGAAEGGESPLGIPSFLWGCVFGVLGVVLVYVLSDEDKAETKKALWGCVASTAVSVVLYMVVWGAWAAAETTY